MVFAIVIFASGLTAQENFLNSPYSSVRTHLFYLQDESYNDSLARLPFEFVSENREKALEHAVRLKQILDGKGLYINVEDIPRSSNYYDSAMEKHRYILVDEYPDIFVEKKGKSWVYAKRSLDEINRIHSETFAFGTDRLLVLLPKFGTRKVLGLYLYQYIAIFILILIAVVIQRVLAFISNKVLLKVLRQAGYEELAKGFLLPIARPFSVLVVLLSVWVFVPVLQLPPAYSYYLLMGFKILTPLLGTVVLYRTANVLSLYLERLARKTTGTLDDQLVPLIRKTLKTFIVVLGTLFILSNLNIDILPLLTGLSIGGLAFALAAQDTIKNFFGSLMIFVDKPFQIGDWITSGDIDGNVEEVGFRSSRVRTFRNSLMYVPNSKLADATIDNHGLRVYRRFYTTIGVTYDTPADILDLFIEGLKKIVENHPDTRKDYYNIYFNDLGAFSLNIMFYIFFKVPNWPAELKARHEILLEIIRLADELGVNFAFPTQTLQMETFPGQPSLSPTYMSKEQVRTRMMDYFDPKAKGN